MESQDYKNGYNDALTNVKKRINSIIKALKRQNPDPLGDIVQCLADGEIKALEIVKNYVIKNKK